MSYHRFRWPNRTKYAIRVVRTKDSAFGPGNVWLMTAGWRPITFRTREAAQTQMELCQKHTRSPFITYYVDEYNN